MDRIDDFVVIPCNCGGLDHVVIYHVSQYKDKDITITIRFPLYHEAESFLARFKNLLRRRFEFVLNVTIDSEYFPLMEYLTKIAFPNKIFEYSVMEYEGSWKLYFMESKITLGFKPTISEVGYYLRCGVIERQFEIYIDEEGPTANSHEKIF